MFQRGDPSPTYIYIYICAVGSISGSHLGVLGPISGPHCWVNQWSTSFRSIKTGVSEDSCEPSFQRGVQSYRHFLVLWSKSGLFKKGMVAICLFSVLFWWLLWMLLLDSKKGWQKDLVFFLREERAKRSERPEVKKNNTIFTPYFLEP